MFLTSHIIPVPHLFTTRRGGVSRGVFDSMNLASGCEAQYFPFTLHYPLNPLRHKWYWNPESAPVSIMVNAKRIPSWTLYNGMAGPQPYSRMYGPDTKDVSGGDVLRPEQRHESDQRQPTRPRNQERNTQKRR